MDFDIGTILTLTLFVVLGPITLVIVGWVVWWFINSGKGEQPTIKIDEIWQRRDEWGEDVCRQLISGEISPGMNEEMVRLTLGEPQTTQSMDGGQVKWLYQAARESDSEPYVLFVAGKVTEFERPVQTENDGLRTVFWIIGLLTVLITVLVVVVLIFGFGAA